MNDDVLKPEKYEKRLTKKTFLRVFKAFLLFKSHRRMFSKRRKKEYHKTLSKLEISNETRMLSR